MKTLLVVGIAGIALWGILIFNRLVTYRNRTRSGWSDIDVQLQRRHDLVPRLVEAVRAYSDYERATMTAVTELRRQSERTDRPAVKARLEDQLARGVDRLLAVAETYPDLKADRNFLDLQEQLVDTEDKLQYARRFYNGAVRELNTRIQSFPDLIVARTLGFREAEYFEAGADTGAAPTVRLGS
ncbi:MAG: LemA family protein [Gammaproteobacteria bacterium]